MKHDIIDSFFNVDEQTKQIKPPKYLSAKHHIVKAWNINLQDKPNTNTIDWAVTVSSMKIHSTNAGSLSKIQMIRSQVQSQGIEHHIK